jgi:hypothetical protein
MNVVEQPTIVGADLTCTPEPAMSFAPGKHHCLQAPPLLGDYVQQMNLSSVSLMHMQFAQSLGKLQSSEKEQCSEQGAGMAFPAKPHST